MQSLIGRKVLVTMIDPWDFVTENGSRRYGKIAEIVDYDDGRQHQIHLKLDEALSTNNGWVFDVWATPRHVGTSVCVENLTEEYGWNFSESRRRDTPDWNDRKFHPEIDSRFIGSISLL